MECGLKTPFKQQLGGGSNEISFFFYLLGTVVKCERQKTPNICEVEQSLVLSELIKLSEDVTHVLFFSR